MPDPIQTPTVTPQAPVAPTEPAVQPVPAPQAPASAPVAPVTEPVAFLNQEDIQALQNYIIQENGEFVYRNPETSTVYKGKTAGEVIQQMLKGIAEKDRIIESNRTRLRGATPPTRTGQPQPQQQPQAVEGGLPIPPDQTQIRQTVYDRLLKETGIDPRYLKLSDTAQEWKDLEIELGAVRASALYQERKDFIRRFEENFSHAMQSENIRYFNDNQGSEAVDSILDWLDEQKITLDQATFDQLLDQSYEPDNAWTKEGRLKQAQFVLNFQKSVAKIKPATSTPPSPVRAAIQQDAQPKNLPPGVASPPAAPSPATPPTQAGPKNTDEAFENIKKKLQTA